MKQSLTPFKPFLILYWVSPYMPSTRPPCQHSTAWNLQHDSKYITIYNHISNPLPQGREGIIFILLLGIPEILIITITSQHHTFTIYHSSIPAVPTYHWSLISHPSDNTAGQTWGTFICPQPHIQTL